MSRIKITICKVLVILSACIVLVRGAAAVDLADGVRRLELENGLTLIVRENHKAPVTSVQVWVETGSADESEKEAGITHFIEHMIFKGTPKRATGEIARAIEESGGRINAYTSMDRTVYYVEIESSRTSTAIDVLLDAVMNSVFDPVEIEREREVILEEYRRYLDMPQRGFSRALMETAYVKHPYRRPIIGYESTIKSIKRDDILAYMARRYLPENIVIVAVGDFDSQEVVRSIEKSAGSLGGKNPLKESGEKAGRDEKGSDKKGLFLPGDVGARRAVPVVSGRRARTFRVSEPEQKALRKMVMDGDVQQASLSLSWHIPPALHTDSPALDLLAAVLADGRSSRLYERLRMKERIVHTIDAGGLSTLDEGIFSVSARLDTSNLPRVLEVLAEETGRIAGTPVSSEELERAKARLESDFLGEMETMSGQARTLGFFQTVYGDYTGLDRYLKDIRALTPEDIMRVASKYLKVERMSVGLMRPMNSKADIAEETLTGLFGKREPLPAVKKSTAECEKVKKATLRNGLRVLVKEERELPLVSVTGAFLGGNRLEVGFPWGISKLASEMLTRGTTGKSASQIASFVESRGGSLSAFSGHNALGLSATFLSRDISKGLDLLAELFIHSSFPEDELTKVKADAVAAIRAKRDNPTPQLFDLFYGTLFLRHPSGHPLTGTEDTILSVKREDLLKWYSMVAEPSRFVIAVSGDVDSEEVISGLEKVFSEMKPASINLPHVPDEPPIGDIRKAHLERPGAQTHIALGYLAGDMMSPDDASLALLETALSGMGGRLFVRLRDKESLAYSVTAFRRALLDVGFFGIYIACDPSKAAAAEDAIFREIKLLREEGLSEEELKGAKRYLLGNISIDTQTNSSQASRMALDELYGLGYDHIERFKERIEKTTGADIKHALGDLIKDNNYIMVTAGPGRGL